MPKAPYQALNERPTPPANRADHGASAGGKSMFSGSIPALVTPFRDGAFDEPAFRKLVEWQIENG
jgi:4-hydroxy-tetrahydrodipicolinate synthase